MTNPNKTLIVTILDRSGSMRPVRNDVIEGFNTVLKDQREAPGEALWTMVQFDDKYEVLSTEVPISDVAMLSTETFVPRGWTALYDALGRTIDEVGQRLAAMKESDRPGKVIVTVFTDGQENCSRKFSGKDIKNKIDHQRNVYNWEFVFIGSDEAAIRDAQQSLGITLSSIFVADSAGITRSTKAHSRGLLSYRSQGVYNDK